MESRRSADDGQAANFVLWCPVDLPDNIEISWVFRPIREPGLAILFFAAIGKDGRNLFDPGLPVRTVPYDQYHHGDIHALHVSYFRRRWAEERAFHTCHLRKSYGFHLVAQGADPIPSVEDATGGYRIRVVKAGGHVTMTVNDLDLFHWIDDGRSHGPILGGGKIGFRQMAPLIAEYANLVVRRITIAP